METTTRMLYLRQFICGGLEDGSKAAKWLLDQVGQSLLQSEMTTLPLFFSGSMPVRILSSGIGLYGPILLALTARKSSDGVILISYTSLRKVNIPGTLMLFGNRPPELPFTTIKEAIQKAECRAMSGMYLAYVELFGSGPHILVKCPRKSFVLSSE